jgi:hypothetical protein
LSSQIKAWTTSTWTWTRLLMLTCP